MQNKNTGLIDSILALLNSWFVLLFNPENPKKNQWFTRLWLTGLYVAGIGLWGLFLHWGSFAYTFEDWQAITGPRLTFLKNAITEGSLPLHISDQYPLFYVTDRFLSFPDQILSPQIFLLHFLSIQKFIIVDVILLYTAGFLGLLWFRRRFSLSLITFSILFLLFNFNGHILAHYAIGHTTWGGYFLFPWFAALVFRLAEGEHGWAWIARMSLLLLAIELQGSYHQFIWCLLFLAFLALAKRATFLTVVSAMVFSVLVNMVRLLPPALLYGKFNDKYLAGYQNLTDIWYAMVNLLAPAEKVVVPMMRQMVNRWELTLFTGMVGALFLLYFGIYRWLKGEINEYPYRMLALPVFGMFILSFDRIFHWARILPIPLLEGERVSSRIISLPFVYVLLLGAIGFQRWIDQPRQDHTFVRLATIGLIFIGGQDLFQNFKSWMIINISRGFTERGFSPNAYNLANHSDPPYIAAIVVGAAISLASIALVLFLALRKPIQPSPE